MIVPINPILKIPLGMLILRQKSFQYCNPYLKTRQPVLSYCGIKYLMYPHTFRKKSQSYETDGKEKFQY